MNFNLFAKTNHINVNGVKSKKELYSHLLIIILLGFVLTFHFARLDFDAHHDGFLFKTAMDVVDGKILFKETFTQYGALVIYLEALAIKMFGETVLAIKLMTTLFYTIIYILTYIIWKRLLSPRKALLTALLTIFLAPFYEKVFHAWSSVYSLAFLLLTLYCCILYIEKGNWYYSFFCGMAIGLTLWSRQSVGLVLFGSVILLWLFLGLTKTYSWKYSIKSLLLNVSGFTVIFIAFVIPIILNNALQDWWIQNYEYMVRFSFDVTYTADRNDLSKTLSMLFSQLLPLSSGKGVIWSLLPLTCIYICVFYLYRTKVEKKQTSQKSLIFLCIAVISLASWAQYYPVNEIAHIYWSAVPMFGFPIYFADKIIKKDIYHKARLVAILMIGVILPFGTDLGNRSFGAIKQIKTYTSKMNSEVFPYLNGLYLREDQIEYYDSLTTAVSSWQSILPDKHILNETGDGIYSLYDSYNFHPLFIQWGIRNAYEDYMDIADKYITEERPIIIANWRMPEDGYVVVYEVTDIRDSNKTIKIMVPEESLEDI